MSLLLKKTPISKHSDANLIVLYIDLQDAQQACLLRCLAYTIAQRYLVLHGILPPILCEIKVHRSQVTHLLMQVSILEAAVLLLRRMPHYKPPRDTDPSLQTFDDLQVFMDHR